MPPKASISDTESITTPLPLQEWLKLLSGRGVDMRVAMMLAGKIYNSHSTKERLSELDNKKLMVFITDKDQRRTVVNALKGVASGEAFTKKRGRDSDLLQPLSGPSSELPQSLEFHEILDPEKLLPISCTTNRAPLKTAFAYAVSLKLGFDPQEALSIAHVFTHISSTKHALNLGILKGRDKEEAEADLRELPREEGFEYVKKTGARGWRQAEEGRVVGSSQPWVGVLGSRYGLWSMKGGNAKVFHRIPVIERTDGTWRAIEKGVPVEPSRAYLYITRALKSSTPYVMGALKLLVDSYPTDELNRVGMSLYQEFKPDVVNWGEKGLLQCSRILDQFKDRVEREEDEDGLTAAEEAAFAALEAKEQKSKQAGEEFQDENVEEEDEDERPQKKAKKDMTVEEYEAMLDSEEAGGFIHDDYELP
ncbi:hypothetical protein P7C73_g6245, partial [Tremellales sp. Uapishka_1]